MGQKVNPIGNRLGIIKGWDSNWYGGKDYSAKLVEDNKIREYLNARLAKASISKIIIERTLKLITVTVNTARPGIIIGKGGQEVDKLKEELKNITKKEVQINIFEVKRPELDATIVANNIARQVEGKISYRRAIKMGIASTMRMGAEGIKVLISGRQREAEMERIKRYKNGRSHLHTLHGDIDFLRQVGRQDVVARRPGLVRLGVVQRVVQPAAFLAMHGAFDNQFGHHRNVPKLDQIGGNADGGYDARSE